MQRTMILPVTLMMSGIYFWTRLLTGKTSGTDTTDDAIDPDGDAAPAAAEVEDGARVAEAGNAYTGRTMDDDLKSSPRVTDGDEAVDEDPTTARDD